MSALTKATARLLECSAETIFPGVQWYASYLPLKVHLAGVFPDGYTLGRFFDHGTPVNEMAEALATEWAGGPRR